MNDWQVDNIYKRAKALDDDKFALLFEKLADEPVEHASNINDDLVSLAELEGEIADEYSNWGKHSGLSTGLMALDNAILGLKPGHLILVGGETSNGKSALAANIAVNVARHSAVLYISLEMLGREIGSRFWHINGGKVEDLNIVLQKERSITWKDIEPLFIRALEEAEIKLVVLDYLQYLGRGMKNEEVAIMSKEMKRLALKYEIPFIVIVSLRKSEGNQSTKRKWYDIEMDDLMGTAAIGYDADIAMIASRKDRSNEFTTDRLWLKILKTRNTALDYEKRFIELLWDRTRVSDLPEGEPAYLAKIPKEWMK